MTSEVMLIVVLLASAGLGLMAYGAAAMVNAAWAAAHLWHLLWVGGLVPFILAVGRGWRGWQRAGVDLQTDRERNKAQAVTTEERWKALEAAVVQAVTDTDDDDPEPPEQRGRDRSFELAHWRIYYRRIMAAGYAYGFDIRTLTDKNRATRVTSQPGWNAATDKLQEGGVLFKDSTGTRALVSQAEWEAGRMWETMPCPLGEPPDIAPPPYNTQQTTAKHEGEAVEGVVVRQ